MFGRKTRFRTQRRHGRGLLPTQKIVLGFVLIILAGAVLLCLPVCSASGERTDFFTGLFTATSATCVTGLVAVDTASHWSFAGQAVILCLIQVGGLGFMAMGAMLSLLLRRRISFSERRNVMESLSLSDYDTVSATLRRILLGTAAFEGAGAVILSARFIPDMGFLRGIWTGLFTSVSAFCNAGFDLMGKKTPFSSMTDYADDMVVNLTLCGLIVLGGLGFLVWVDLLRRPRRLSAFTKTVLLTSLALVLAGALGFFLFEYDNPDTLGGLSWKGKILASLFQSVSPRTAGMNTVNLAATRESTRVLTILLMFVGGSSGSTAGGIKVATLTVMLAALAAALRGRREVTLMKRRVSTDTVLRAFAVAALALTMTLASSFALSVANPDLSFLSVLYECTSAYATVGLTLGLTPALGLVSKSVLIFLMFCGRVGTLTISFALTMNMNRQQNKLHYPEARFLIG